MQTVIDALKTVLGNPEFYRQMPSYSGSNNYAWDYGAMLQYMVAAAVLCIVISWIFRFIHALFFGKR